MKINQCTKFILTLTTLVILTACSSGGNNSDDNNTPQTITIDKPVTGYLISETNGTLQTQNISSQDLTSITINDINIPLTLENGACCEEFENVKIGIYEPLNYVYQVGIPTTNEIPSTGEVEYQGKSIYREESNNNTPIIIAGEVYLVADFGNKNIRGEIYHFKNGEEIPYNIINFKDVKIEQSGFKGEIISINMGENQEPIETTGNTEGKFYGPNAGELGGIARFNDKSSVVYAAKEVPENN
ncbi:transferrin-binding protein-like solute binding protein [Volucribacter amazonae]|uniref:Transferrin-binding protein B C-lobe/N-lobe beta-barrel domain-containing protein n=1 Tax=Volucribacter amazonae TaxID=256731 RepID=A0A9X4SIQ3_9PAST|nr:transferrin-binding protein-like solute binding protein [Volucribacter amazonae]MDG6895887.1 hypothetical protein [Volucribacter amazonae]